MPLIALDAGKMSTCIQIGSVEEAWQTLQKGAEARHSAETSMNERSSRSHCMLCIKVRGQSKITGVLTALHPSIHSGTDGKTLYESCERLTGDLVGEVLQDW